MKMKKKRETGIMKNIKYELNLMNVFFCILVVFIHIASEAISTLKVDSWQFLIIYIPHKLSSFVVYGFIFISAMKLFIKDINKINLLEYYKNRLKKIVFPYCISVCIYYVYFVLNNYFKFDLIELFKYIINGNLVAHFYFIIIIVQFYLLLPVWKLILKKIKPSIMIIASFIITIIMSEKLPVLIKCLLNESDFIYNDRIFTTYLFYWIFGMYAGTYYNKFCALLRKYKKILIFSFSILAFLYIYINYNFVINGMFAKYLNVLQNIYVTISILFFYSLFLKISQMTNMAEKVKTLNDASYDIYLYHVMAIFIITDLLNKHCIYRVSERFAFKMFLVYAIILIYSFLKNFLKNLSKK